MPTKDSDDGGCIQGAFGCLGLLINLFLIWVAWDKLTQIQATVDLLVERGLD